MSKGMFADLNNLLPDTLYLHFISDLIIGVLFFLFLAPITYLVWKRKDLRFNWEYWVAASFLLAAGTSFILGSYTILTKNEIAHGLVNAFAVLMSLGAAIVAVTVLRRALKYPSPDELLEINEKLRLQSGELQSRVASSTNEIVKISRRFEKILESVPYPILAFDRKGRVTLSNTEACRQFGYTKQEFLSLNGLDLFPLRERKRYEKSSETFLANPEPRFVPASTHLTLMRKDGTEFPVEVGVNPVPGDDEIRVISAFVNISDRRQIEMSLKKREAHLRQMADSMPHAVWSANPRGQIEFFSKRWFDYTRPDLTRVSNWLSLVHPSDRGKVETEWNTFIETNQPFEFQFRLWNQAQNSYRWNLARGVPLKTSSGAIIAWYGSFTDIDEKIKLEVALREADKAKDEFLATLSHELRSPMHIVIGYLDLLNTCPPDSAEFREAVDAIQRNARAQMQLVSDLLDVSRIITGKMSLNFTSFEIGALVESAVEIARFAARTKNLKINVSIAPDIGTMIGDRIRLQQVLWNLLSNSVKFTPSGGVIEVQAKREDSTVIFSVKDSGQGLAPEALPQVFRKFWQEDHTLGKKLGGLGLGLSIVSHIAEMHHGAVTAESNGKGHGATFTVRLPVNPPATPAPGGPALDVAQPAAIAKPGPSEKPLSGLNILVVDDQPDALSLIKTILSKAGASVILASSAAAALAVCDETPFNLVISDIGMPEIDGYTFIKKLRNCHCANANSPAIALTAYARETEAAAALAAGFQLHLSKPIEPSALVAAADNLARRTVTV